MKELTPRQRQHLKGLGHSLKPVINVGKEGISENLLNGVSKALDDHELIKISILDTSGLERKEASKQISEAVGAQLVSVVGFKILLFRRNEKKPKIVLP
ncbi:RNA binding protein [Chitinispirillum alkaliphilum]|nr:RNA binding protein [Chitinispirillum alkaliphilum]